VADLHAPPAEDVVDRISPEAIVSPAAARDWSPMTTEHTSAHVLDGTCSPARNLTSRKRPHLERHKPT